MEVEKGNFQSTVQAEEQYVATEKQHHIVTLHRGQTSEVIVSGCVYTVFRTQ